MVALIVVVLMVALLMMLVHTMVLFGYVLIGDTVHAALAVFHEQTVLGWVKMIIWNVVSFALEYRLDSLPL
jgi:hypothetical protein